METNVNYTVVGAFVIILVAFVVLSIIWLSAGFSVEHFTTYKVYMKESVRGLSPDAPVEYNGVNVGQVASIELNRRNPQWVELLLDIKSDVPITKGTSAILTVKGITGIAYVALKDKGTDLTPLKALPGERYPVINTAPSIFLQLDSMLTELNASFSQLSESVKSLLNPQNQRSIKNILINLDQITKNLSATSNQFSPLMRNSVSTMQVLSTQTLPIANQAIINFDNVANDLSDISAEIKQNPSVLIRGTTPQALGPGEQ